MAVGDGVAVGVGVGVGVATTTTLPLSAKLPWEWNGYVPGTLNVHVPAQPGPCVYQGSGGFGDQMSPAVCAHEVGCAPSKKTLWRRSRRGS